MSHFLRFHNDTLVLDIVVEKQVVHSIDLMTCLTLWSALDHLAIVKNHPWSNFEIWARGEWREKGVVR